MDLRSIATAQRPVRGYKRRVSQYDGVRNKYVTSNPPTYRHLPLILTPSCSSFEHCLSFLQTAPCEATRCEIGPLA